MPSSSRAFYSSRSSEIFAGHRARLLRALRRAVDGRPLIVTLPACLFRAVRLLRVPRLSHLSGLLVRFLARSASPSVSAEPSWRPSSTPNSNSVPSSRPSSEPSAGPSISCQSPLRGPRASLIRGGRFIRVARLRCLPGHRACLLRALRRAVCRRALFLTLPVGLVRALV